MSALVRSLVLVAVTVAAVLGLTVGPAQAAFDDRTTTVNLGVATTKVVAPANLNTGGTKCVTTYDSFGNPTTTLQAKLSWTASTTAKVTSYEVIAYSTGWSYSVTTVAAPTTVVTGSYDSYYATQNIQVTVRAKTSYGWTAESAKSGVIKC